MFTTFLEYVIVVFRIKLHILAIQTLSHLAPTFLPTLHPYSSQPAAKLISSQTAGFFIYLGFSPCYLLLPSLPFPTQFECPSSKNSALLPLLLQIIFPPRNASSPFSQGTNSPFQYCATVVRTQFMSSVRKRTACTGNHTHPCMSRPTLSVRAA